MGESLSLLKLSKKRQHTMVIESDIAIWDKGMRKGKTKERQRKDKGKTQERRRKDGGKTKGRLSVAFHLWNGLMETHGLMDSWRDDVKWPWSRNLMTYFRSRNKELDKKRKGRFEYSNGTHTFKEKQGRTLRPTPLPLVSCKWARVVNGISMN